MSFDPLFMRVYRVSSGLPVNFVLVFDSSRGQILFATIYQMWSTFHCRHESHDTCLSVSIFG